jgi:ProP effector
MSKAAKRPRIAAVIKLLCDRFPQMFSRDDPRPLKVGVHADVLAALGGAVRPHDLKSALRAYTSNDRYLRALSAGACRMGLEGETTGIVTPEDEAVAKKRLAEWETGAAGRAKMAPAAQTRPQADESVPTAENPQPAALSAPKRLSLADLRAAGRRRREAAA